MSPPVIDEQALAAFLDGRAAPDERARVLTLIAGSQDAYDEFSEAVAILRAAERPTAEPMDDTATAAAGQPLVPSLTVDGVPRSTERTASRGQNAWARRRSLAIPAMLLAAALVIVVLPRSRGEGPSTAVRPLAEAVMQGSGAGPGSVSRSLGAGWEEPGWSVMRGTDSALPAHSEAFRIGVRFVHVTLAMVAQDSIAMVAAATALQQELSDVDGSASVAAAVGAVATAGSTATADLDRLAERVRAASGSAVWFDLGTWLGAARVATLTSQADFFVAGGAPMLALDQRLQQPTEDDVRLTQVHGLLQSLRPAASSARDSMPALREQLDRAIRLSAGTQ